MFSPAAAIAREALQAGRFMAAEELARGGLRTSPQDFGLHTVLAMCLAERGDLAAADAEAEKAIAHNQSSGWPHLARARAFVLRARLDSYHREELLASALIELDQALELEPDEPIHWRNLAQAYADAGNPQAAIQAARQTLTLATGDTAAACLLADLLVRLDRLSEAEAVLAALPASAGDDPNVQFSRGRVLLHTQRIDEAADALQQAVDQGCHSLAEATQLLRETRKARYWFYRPWLRWELWLSRHLPSPRRQKSLGQAAIAGLVGLALLLHCWENVAATWMPPETARNLVALGLLAPMCLIGVVGGILILRAMVTLCSDLMLVPHPWRLWSHLLAILGCVILAVSVILCFWEFQWIRWLLGAVLVLGFGSVVVPLAWNLPPERPRALAMVAAIVSMALSFPFLMRDLVHEQSFDLSSLCLLAAICSLSATVSMAASRGRRRGMWMGIALVSVAISAVASAILVLAEAATAAGALASVAIALAFAATVYSFPDALRALDSAEQSRQRAAARRARVAG